MDYYLTRQGNQVLVEKLTAQIFFRKTDSHGDVKQFKTKKELDIYLGMFTSEKKSKKWFKLRGMILSETFKER